MLRRRKRLVSGRVWEAYYYNGRDESGRRVEIPLGTDINEAKRKWAELESKPAPVEIGIMKVVFDRYEREIVPTKAPETQKGNIWMLAMLRSVFDSAPIDAITPQHIAQYRDNRKSKKKGSAGKPATVRANREISLFSHIWNIAREWGYTAKENPVKGVRKNKETPREFYADAEVWDAVYRMATIELQDAMDIAYLTGQRPADVLKMRFSDIKNGAIEVRQNKGKKKLRILMEDQGARTALGALVDRIKGRGRKVASVFIVATPSGQGLSISVLQNRFSRARAAAASSCTDAALSARIREFQFRDIRPKAASETDLSHASRLLGHSDKRITEAVYRRIGETVLPTK